MVAVTTQSFELHKGDDVTLNFTITTDGTATGTPIDITGATVKWTLATHPGATAKVTKTATITDAANGKVKVTLASSDTKDLDDGIWYHELESTDINGNQSTVAQGQVNLLGSSS